MKKIYNIVAINLLTLTLLTLIAESCSDDKSGFIIKGEIDYGDKSKPKEGEVYLISLSKFEPFKDTTAIKRGKFTFKGEIKTPGLVFIKVKDLKGSARLYLENANYNIVLNPDALGRSEIEGGETQRIIAKIDSARASGASFKEISDLKDKLAYENPLSSYALDVLTEESKTMAETAPVAEKLQGFMSDKRYSESYNIKIVQEMIEKKRHLDPGKPAPLMTLRDKSGKVVDLAPIIIRNKITMFYFWAGANPESRIQNQNLKLLYEKFKARGLEIVGVTLDDIKGEWLDAVKSDKLPWINLYDNGTLSNFIPVYEITSIPQNVFVDNKGIIIKRRVPFNEIEVLLERNLP